MSTRQVVSPSKGTCWLYEDNLVVTAAHVTGKEDVVDDVVIDGWGTAKVAWRDYDLELALLVVTKPVPQQRLTIGSGIELKADMRWEGYGYPRANPGGKTLPGKITSRSKGVSREGMPGLIELSYDDGGAGDAGGASGSAVIVDNVVVGVLTEEMSESRGLLAAPIDWLTRYCPRLRRPTSLYTSIHIIVIGGEQVELVGVLRDVANTLNCNVTIEIAHDKPSLLDRAQLAVPLVVVGASMDLSALAPLDTLWSDLTFVALDAATAFEPSHSGAYWLLWSDAKRPSRERFRARLSRRLIDVLDSDDVIPQLRSAVHDITRRSASLLQTHSAESTFLRFYAGWLRQIPLELPGPSASSFRASTRYYRECLLSLNGWNSTGEAVAVADLSDSIEQWWLTSEGATKETRVKERIFLLNSHRVITGDNENRHALEPTLEETLKFLKSEANKHYTVRVARLPDRNAGQTHPFGADRGAWDIILFPSTEGGTVGGYVKTVSEGGRTRYVLQISCDPDVFRRADEYYKMLQSSSIEFDASWTLDDLRRHWTMKYKVGKWKGAWTSATTIDGRGESYFSFYDEHIRCWVPHYEQLLGLCSVYVSREVVSRSASKRDSLALLEIGYGTGALTSELVRWLGQYRAISAAKMFMSYEGIDPSTEMQKRARSRILHHLDGRLDGRPVQLHGGEFPNAMVKPLDHPPDIIVGSLVLHDIWGNDWKANLPKLFEECANHLKDGGALIFADVLFGAKRVKQRSYWHDWIKARCTDSDDEDAADRFLQHNKDMDELAPTVDELRQVAQQHGFESKELPNPAGHGDNPFGVIRFRSARGPAKED